MTSNVHSHVWRHLGLNGWARQEGFSCLYICWPEFEGENHETWKAPLCNVICWITHFILTVVLVIM